MRTQDCCLELDFQELIKKYILTALESTKCYLIFFEQRVTLFFLFILAKADVLGCVSKGLDLDY